MSGKNEAGKRVLVYGVLFLLLAGVLAAGWFHEELGNYLRLRGWDTQAPARAVSAFIESGKKGDTEGTRRHFASDFHHPLVKNGKLVGYVLDARGEWREYPFAPLGNPNESVIIYDGGGYARVRVPSSARKIPIYYHLEMKGGDWKITWID